MKSIFLFLIFILSSFAQPIKIAYQDRVIDSIFIIANYEKMFEKANLDVDLRKFTSGAATNEALIFGDVSMATMGDTAAIIAISKFPSQIKIYSLLGGGEKRHSVVVRTNSKINSFEDLKGKKVAIKKGTSTHGGFLLKAQQKGLNLNKELIDLSPSLMAQALLTKEIDAIVASEPTPTQIIEKGFAKRITTLEGLGTNYPLALMIKTNRFDKEKMPKILEVLKQSANFILNNPDRSYEIVSKATGLSITATKEAMQKHDYKVGFDEYSFNSLKKVALFLKEERKIRKLPDLDLDLIR